MFGGDQKEVFRMQRSTLIFAALIAGAVHVHAQGLLQTITTPEKAVPVVNQTLEGTWLLELRRPGTPAGQAPVSKLIIFHRDGTVVDAGSSLGSSALGLWIRVGDRKFLQTMFGLNFNESQVLTTITKVRINVQLSPDGQTLSGTTEVAILDPQGRVMATIPGGTYSAVRLRTEIPGDFYDFQKVQ
jgi:hypothetical protein